MGQLTNLELCVTYGDFEIEICVKTYLSINVACNGL